MFLAVDIGNSKTAFGVYAPGEPRSRLSWRLSSDARRTPDEYGLPCVQALRERGIDPTALRGAGAVSVVPGLEPVLRKALETWLGLTPAFITAESQDVLAVAYNRPADLGPDRVVNAAFAFSRFGGPVLVVDVGTAVTFDLVAADGVFLGGAIFPGLDALTDALCRHGARLPRVSPTWAEDPVGTSTAACIRSGVGHGFRFAVAGLMAAYRERFPDGLRTVLTGGGAEGLAGVLPRVDAVEPDLTLDGVRFLCERRSHERTTP
ncbi:MAG: type III pantothenate kinase [Acidobacteria bacterium]|nr:type III pantothenate kinase [Acidobacteriota bacterium]